MNPSKLRERQVAIAATPLGHRNTVHNGGRRQLPKNNISTESPIDQSYSNFFEYEQELAGMKPSAELFSTLEENNDKEVASSNRILLEELSEEFYQEEGAISNPTNSTNSSIILEEVDHNTAASFDFIQCNFIKQNGEKCKRQAPKNHKFCSKHKGLTLI